MEKRKWQAECINLALDKYTSGNKHFLALATPGAGKTFMASALGNEIIKRELADIIICFSPSSVVCEDFSETLESVIGERFDGLLGSKGRSLTYQSMKYLDEDFWMLFQKYRVFVIFDEIHHCSGSNIENANAWGEKIILNIRDNAEFTLAMTGTPWRSDTAPIVLSHYSSFTNKIRCDYVYGLSKAIRDGVCRKPQIIVIDNDNISLTDKGERKSFSSFKELLTQSVFPYQDIIQNEQLLLHTIRQANDRLDKLRITNPTAGGLIVASSVEHTTQIEKLMAEHFNEAVTVITYREDEPTKLIHHYRQSSSKWVVSVGMISEGTNIPRLQVTCHLTRIKTEMNFRQLQGRNLRITDAPNQDAFLYMPAEPKLVEYAFRVAQDIPFEADVVKFEKMSTHFKAKQKDDDTNEGHIDKVPEDKVKGSSNKNINIEEERLELGEFEERVYPQITPTNEKNPLTNTYESMMNIFGRFKQETLELGLSTLE
ncbi:DEAD/DEAH box helicase [Colwellia demingiae]|uniref:DEAD/DEAH box helicase n=1 Tax=Colwellia demingiae TaxID=89401 RepID=A0A5C6QHC4_9GAMM|nr:DEAD/DEAH box helicase family protein [Colwellia demingiae]TWX68057.1 DEAD/DEAH box helicase [Colwellia demingiae]